MRIFRPTTSLMLVFTIVSSICLTPAFAQDDDNVLLEEIAEEIASKDENEQGLDDIAETITNLSDHKIFINTASEKELESLFWLNAFQIQSILTYRKMYGAILSAPELTYIPGITEEDARRLAPFLSFTSVQSRRSFSHHKILFRSKRIIQPQNGYAASDSIPSSGSFRGGPSYFFSRYGFSHNNRFFAGITAEKDPGETFFRADNPGGFDFYSGFIQIQDLHWLKNILLGDYRLSFGQGLVAGSGNITGKSSSILNPARWSTGITRFQSADENQFFRGIASSIEAGPADVTLFYSKHNADANVTAFDSINHIAKEVSSLQTSGIHATAPEISDKHTIGIQTWGSHITFHRPGFVFGATAISYSFSAYLNPTYQPYNHFYFRGNENFNLSVNFRYRYKNIIIFGEEATCKSKGYALLNGLQSYINSNISVNLIYRNYQRNYQALYGHAFGENSTIENEEGIFVSCELRPFRFFTLSAYCDLFRFPWLKYGVDMPSAGREFMAQIVFSPANKFQMYLQYRNKHKEENNTSLNLPLSTIENTVSERMRSQYSYQVTSSVKIAGRIEVNRVIPMHGTSYKGFYLGHDLIVDTHKWPLKWYVRYTLFDTDAFDSRIYAYENDLPGTYSIPALFNKGTRFYVMLKCTPWSHTNIWLKYSTTQYRNSDTIGTGPYQINGNTQSEVKGQVSVQF